MTTRNPLSAGSFLLSVSFYIDENDAILFDFGGKEFMLKVVSGEKLISDNQALLCMEIKLGS